jgi:DNA-binding XRE family transcriptional regulator
MAEIIKTNEKLIIWMHRSRYTQEEIARELHITRQTLSAKIRDNYWTAAELQALKRLGVE